MTATSDISVGIKTFLRTAKLKMCLESLAQLPWREVIVADDGTIDDEREQMYADYARRLPLTLIRLPFDTGLSAGRNEIVQRCQTDCLLMLDDDQTVRTDIGRLREVLEENPAIGGVSCIWVERDGRKCTACDIHVEGRRIVKEIRGEKPIRTTASGQRYALFDFIPNSTLFRMQCLRDQAWDPFYKIGKEHLDFYLMQQRLGKWKFAVSLDVEIGHHPEGATENYDKYRHGKRVKVSERYFLDKFQVDEVVEGRKLLEAGGEGPSWSSLGARMGSVLSAMLGKDRRT